MFLYAIILVLCTTLAVRADDTGCTVDGKTVNVGEQYDNPGHCSLNVCKGKNEWTQMACGVVGTPTGWSYVPEDKTKGYPECCGHADPPLQLVPDVLDQLRWADMLNVTYEGGVSVSLGNELTPTQVKSQPQVTYSAEPAAWYLLCMTDPDAPSRNKPTSREFLHWLIGNIPGSEVSAGDQLAGYVGSGPPQGSGLHRYALLLYKQPAKLTFDEPRVPSTSAENRRLFSIRKLAKKYNMGNPIEINVYQAQYDDYVPEIHKQLGFVKKN